jgi:hypothetical protein
MRIVSDDCARRLIAIAQDAASRSPTRGSRLGV